MASGIILVLIGAQKGSPAFIVLGLIVIGAPALDHRDVPRPGPSALPQALDMEAEEIHADCEGEIRAVTVEFLRRPLSLDSISELESEVDLALSRRDEAMARLDERAGIGAL